MVKEFGGSVVFLHKIARGSANRSFGIEVAALAGLPDELIKRAKQILARVEAGEKGYSSEETEKPLSSLNNVNYEEIINILKEMDMNTISPLMAFGTLQNLVDKVRK